MMTNAVTTPSSSTNKHPIVWTHLALLFFYTLVFFAAMVFLFLKKSSQPLKARSPALLAVSSFGGYLQVFWVTMLASHVADPGTQLGCSLGAWAMTLGHPLLFTPYVLRCYRLHLIFNLTIEKESATQRTLDGTTKYYHERKHRISDKFLMRVMLVVLFVAACVAALDEYFALQSVTSSERLYVCNYQSKDFVVVWDAVRFIETLIFTVSLYKLWGVADAFSIRMELLGVCGVWLGNLTLRVVLGLYHPKMEYWVTVQPYAIVARSAVCLLVSVIVPTAMTMLGRRPSGVILWSENASLASLRDTLHDPNHVMAFQRFMVKRFSVENVLFWMEVELYRANSSPTISFYDNHGGSDALDRMYHSEEADLQLQRVDRDTMEAEARSIVKRYVIREAHLALTAVNDVTKMNIERRVDAGIFSSDMFDDAQTMVYEYMKAECWDDFLQSTDCRRGMRKVEKQETIRSRLIVAGMIDREQN